MKNIKFRLLGGPRMSLTWVGKQGWCLEGSFITQKTEFLNSQFPLRREISMSRNVYLHHYSKIITTMQTVMQGRYYEHSAVFDGRDDCYHLVLLFSDRRDWELMSYLDYFCGYAIKQWADN